METSRRGWAVGSPDPGDAGQKGAPPEKVSGSTLGHPGRVFVPGRPRVGCHRCLEFRVRGECQRAWGWGPGGGSEPKE